MTLRTTPAAFPRDMTVTIRLDDDPRYKGSIHDDQIARARGYRAALVPGAFIYGHVSRIAIEAWGRPWAERGAMGVRFRRPVFNGDTLRLDAGPLQDRDGTAKAEVGVHNQYDQQVATGWVGAPASIPLPELSQYQLLPRPEHPSAVAAGELHAGVPVTTANRVLSQDDFRRSLSAFDERHPIYADPGFIHSGCLMRLAMGDTNNSFAFPSPVILVSAEARHFAPVWPGQRIATVGRITNAYERNGKHYFDSEELLSADGVLAARFSRTSIYAYD
jgi:acyl dehydratase